MKPRTLIALLIALAAGAVASIATYDLVHAPAPPHAQSEDSDTGLTP